MRLREIEAVRQDFYNGGNEDLSLWAEDLRGEGGTIFNKNLKATSDPGILYYVQRKNVPSAFVDDADYLFALADSNTTGLVGIMTLHKTQLTTSPRNLDAYYVHTITVSEDYRGRNLAMMMYMLAIKEYGLILQAGGEQTPGGRRNWVRLNQQPGVHVVGLIKVDSPSKEQLPMEQLKFIGTLGRHQVYIFNVFPGPTQLRSLVREINLYHQGSRIMDATMIAIAEGSGDAD